MKRYLISTGLLVLGIATLKTALVSMFVLPQEHATSATVSGLFALFTVMTAGVAYLAYTRLIRFLADQRRKKLAPGGGDTVSKEAVVQKYAQEWGLSKAEAEVALFAAKGFSNSEIAEMRGCAVPTVKTQLGNIYQKSNLESRYQLIAFVTDEVCDMAAEPEEAATAQTPATNNVTPMVKRLPRTSDRPTPDMAQQAMVGQ